MSIGVLDVDDIEGARMSLPMSHDADSPQVSTADYHAQVPGVELDEVGDFRVGDVVDDAIVNVDLRIWIADGSTVVSHDERNPFRPHRKLFHLAEFHLRLFWSDTVNSVPTLYVVDKPKLFPRFFDCNYVHEACGEVMIRSDFAVHLDQSLVHDLDGLLIRQSVLQPISEEYDEREAFSELVRPSAGSRRKDTGLFIQQPMSRGCDTL